MKTIFLFAALCGLATTAFAARTGITYETSARLGWILVSVRAGVAIAVKTNSVEDELQATRSPGEAVRLPRCQRFPRTPC